MPYGYAEYMFESLRENRGLDMKDTSQDDEILKKLQGGKKMSKSDMPLGSTYDREEQE